MKKDISLIFVLGVILIAGLTGIFYKFNQNDYEGNLSLKQNIPIELGSQLDSKLETYINFTGLSESEINDIKTNATLYLPTNVNEKGYLDAGDYAFYVEYQGTRTFSNVVVKDTTPPKIDTTQKVMLPLYIEVEDFSQYFKIDDYSECTIEVTDTNKFTSKYDGKFEITAKVTDAAGNSAVLKQPIQVSWLAGNASNNSSNNNRNNTTN